MPGRVPGEKGSGLSGVRRRHCRGLEQGRQEPQAWGSDKSQLRPAQWGLGQPGEHSSSWPGPLPGPKRRGTSADSPTPNILD